MKVKGEKKNTANQQEGKGEKNTLQGYPVYPESDDIYSKYEEEKDIDPEDISKIKDLNDDISGPDLDIPGSELDDKLEDTGSEDEENNYYSIGGDGHDNLDEDRLEEN